MKINHNIQKQTQQYLDFLSNFLLFIKDIALLLFLKMMEKIKVFKIIVFLMSLLVCSDAIYGMQTRTYFDLPKDTPGLQTKRKRMVVDGISNVLCVHIIVPNSEASKTIASKKVSGKRMRKNKLKQAIEDAQFDSGNIYFPVDGTQPTAEEAAKYSCANVDNTGESPITEWYIKMFGLIPCTNKSQKEKYVEAGYDKKNHRVRIIQDETNTNDFKKVFKKIAKSSVGRVLLYRILLEIRRRGNHKNGACEQDINNTEQNILIRNASRCLGIVKEENNSFVQTRLQQGDASDKKVLVLGTPSQSLKFDEQSHLNFNANNHETTVVGKLENNVHYFIHPEERPVEVAVFHELVHWYHFLRYTDRFIEENGNNIFCNKLEKLSSASLGKYFYANLDGTGAPSRETVSAESWKRMFSTGKNLCYTVSYEEMRTILGSDPSVEGYINGDDLCENLYRLYMELPIRFSHSDEQYLEDKNVIDRAIIFLNDNQKFYNLSTVKLSSEFSNKKYTKRGLGNCLREETNNVSTRPLGHYELFEHEDN